MGMTAANLATEAVVVGCVGVSISLAGTFVISVFRAPYLLAKQAEEENQKLRAELQAYSLSPTDKYLHADAESKLKQFTPDGRAVLRFFLGRYEPVRFVELLDGIPGANKEQTFYWIEGLRRNLWVS